MAHADVQTCLNWNIQYSPPVFISNNVRQISINDGAFKLTTLTLFSLTSLTIMISNHYAFCLRALNSKKNVKYLIYFRP